MGEDASLAPLPADPDSPYGGLHVGMAGAPAQAHHYVYMSERSERVGGSGTKGLPYERAVLWLSRADYHNPLFRGEGDNNRRNHFPLRDGVIPLRGRLYLWRRQARIDNDKD